MHALNASVCALLLLCAAVRADPPGAPPAEFSSSPEQHPGQLAQIRLAALYPVLAPLPPRAPTASREARLVGYLEDTDVALKNLRGLEAYLDAGLADPRAVARPNAQWDGAWRALDAELGRLKPLTALGAELSRGPVPVQRRFGSSKAAAGPSLARRRSVEGRRLRRAEETVAAAEKQRARLLLKSQPQ